MIIAKVFPSTNSFQPFATIFFTTSLPPHAISLLFKPSTEFSSCLDTTQINSSYSDHSSSPSELTRSHLLLIIYFLSLFLGKGHSRRATEIDVLTIFSRNPLKEWEEDPNLVILEEGLRAENVYSMNKRNRFPPTRLLSS
ncbi:hypothetical protein AVEN_33387-1 [Araneus ventricosus]|uniref:Uncharacterized protein n=1 Tax=Araneus ventricosus TaxID=182803 RepID=A0A4Y2MLH7_ARAVE|nr:hypothetical protein AVEN_33387-1 [Araneus ventricosus]